MLEGSTGHALVRTVAARGPMVMEQVHRTAEEDHEQNEDPDHPSEIRVHASRCTPTTHRTHFRRRRSRWQADSS
jgi:hypothetical protein